MDDEARVSPWSVQSAVTEVGGAGPAIDALPEDPAALRAVSQQLVAHYMYGGDERGSAVTGPRLAEVDTRYADAMFARLLALGEPDLGRTRPLDERLVGCCRDFSVLYAAMARHKGIPARLRVGYASYFAAGWLVDHVVVEVWDAAERRWRLVEPQTRDGFQPDDGPAFDPLDVPPDRFVTGARAWLMARAGQIEPERFVVTPDFDIPYTRGWFSLRHHVVQDLAALNRTEMVLWDQWGILLEGDPLQHADLLDEVAAAIADPDVVPETIAHWGSRAGFQVTPTVVSYSPTQFDPLEADVRRTLQSR